MLFFKTRNQVRDFVKNCSNAKLVDNGSNAPSGRRWAAKVL
jgi:hypothetical protein